MDYLLIKEVADKWHLTVRQVQQLCSDGRIDGVKRIGRMWFIPLEAKKPKDMRKKNTKFKNLE